MASKYEIKKISGVSEHFRGDLENNRRYLG